MPYDHLLTCGLPATSPNIQGVEQEVMSAPSTSVDLPTTLNMTFTTHRARELGEGGGRWRCQKCKEGRKLKAVDVIR